MRSSCFNYKRGPVSDCLAFEAMVASRWGIRPMNHPPEVS